MSSARAAINAALEAARAASGTRAPPKRPQVAAAPAPEPQAPPAQAVAPSAPPPWEQQGPQADAAQPPQSAQDEEPPSWATEFSDDTAVAEEAPAVVAAPVQARAPAAPRHAYVITPVPQIDWDGNWPALAATLPLRGVSQQLALQTELVSCESDGSSAVFKLRAPIDTLRASGNTEKLAAAVQERFAQVRVAVEIDVGPVWYTASAEAQAYREKCQREAEATVDGDPFVQEMARCFDAFVVPGSVRPAPSAAA